MVGMALAGCAGTSGWHALRIDATSASHFEASVAALRQTLPPNHRLFFEVALQELWNSTASKVGAESSVGEATKDYFAQLDGLGYEQVISLAGPEAKQKYLALAPRNPMTQAPTAARKNSWPSLSMLGTLSSSTPCASCLSPQ
jgi:hypothetical protein